MLHYVVLQSKNCSSNALQVLLKILKHKGELSDVNSLQSILGLQPTCHIWNISTVRHDRFMNHFTTEQ